MKWDIPLGEMIQMGFWIWMFCGLAIGTAPSEGIKRSSFLGTWEGGPPDGLWCRIELERERGKMFTFQGNKHLITLNFWWNLNQTKEKLTFGVNGGAKILENGELQLMLQPANTNIVTVREAVLKRVRAE